MRDDFDKLLFGHAILNRALNMKGQLFCPVHCDKCGDGCDAAIAFREDRPLPHVTEKDVFGEIRKFRRNVADSFVHSSTLFHN